MHGLRPVPLSEPRQRLDVSHRSPTLVGHIRATCHCVHILRLSVETLHIDFSVIAVIRDALLVVEL